MNHEHALQRAIRYVGSQAALAARLSVKKRRINSWLNRDKKIPFHYAIAIEWLTDGTVNRYELAPYAKGLQELLKE